MAALIAEKITTGSEKREFLLACMRTVTAKLRAYQFEVETIGLALKSNRITNAEATEWLRESCLIDETMSSAVRNWDDQNGTIEPKQAARITQLRPDDRKMDVA